MQFEISSTVQVSRTAKRKRSLRLSQKCAALVPFIREALDSYGLTDYAFRYNQRRYTLGLCFLKSKRIELSTHLVDNNGEDRILDTLMHEIAHAIAYRDYGDNGHGPCWRAVAANLGAKPEPCCTDKDLDMGDHEAKYRAVCPSCQYIFRHFRLSKRTRNGGKYCMRCGPTNGRLTFFKIR